MQEARLKDDGDEAYYRMAFAWQDPDGDPATKAAYKFIHHEVDDDGKIMAANMRACLTGIAVINGARGGTTIPEADREGVYRHLAAHMRDSGAEPPEMKRGEQMDTKSLPLELKQISEDGTFEGFLSVYDFVDAGGDVVEKGAFTRTLKNSGGKVVLCWQHDLRAPIGVLELRDGDEALEVKGTLNRELGQAREAHSMMRFMQAHGLKMGLSIGFQVVKDSIDKGIRRLKEIKLFEGSLVTIPMNRLCFVTDVKTGEPLIRKDFSEAYEMLQAWAMRQMMHEALCGALDEAFYGGDLTRDERAAAVAKAIDDYRAAFLAALPVMFGARGIKGTLPIPHSEHEWKVVLEINRQSQALLDGQRSTSVITEPAPLQPGPADTANDSDELHSLLVQGTERWTNLARR
jgi:hypothetical protein